MEVLAIGTDGGVGGRERDALIVACNTFEDLHA